MTRLLLQSKTPDLTSLQRPLLEPFTVPHSVPHFEIAGPTNTKHRASIAAQVSRMAPTVGECFDKVIELSDKGHKERRRKDLERRKESLQCGLY